MRSRERRTLNTKTNKRRNPTGVRWRLAAHSAANTLVFRPTTRRGGDVRLARPPPRRATRTITNYKLRMEEHSVS